ncbi:MAG: hypothetical protein GWN58_45440 [Anaerolineae bacterium]|nr:hypothetical protein [Anaerolineae bacterium]
MSVLVGSAADVAGLFVEGSQEAEYVAKVLALSPIAYWILGEHLDSTAICQINRNQNGTYTATTLGNAGIGDGQVCPSFDGAASYVDVYSATLDAAFDGAEGTLSIWGKVSDVGVWTDGAGRRLVRLWVDSNNYIQIIRSTVDNRLFYDYKAGGTAKGVAVNGLSETGWMHLAETWSATADEMKAFYNGAQTGATQSGLGAWAGSLDNTMTIIGAESTVPAGLWKGYGAHVALWASVLTPAQIASLASV